MRLTSPSLCEMSLQDGDQQKNKDRVGEQIMPKSIFWQVLSFSREVNLCFIKAFN
jgi:hypothetical protein